MKAGLKLITNYVNNEGGGRVAPRQSGLEAAGEFEYFLLFPGTNSALQPPGEQFRNGLTEKSDLLK
ncbi:hypothetical protein [Bhargavaea cecembensis]|uniref:hypothetical protein n=1 Tax=Bhargavaea cecembensis TaxID=394098 RepID=UPI000556A8D3|nr:hypothetical protein [Bhargavaea cecembensis]